MAKQNQKADEKSKSAPKLPDRYLNTVFGNVLDEAVNTSYNLKLYMIKDRTSGGGGYINGAVAAKPEETVVIAQTGVTGVQMDGLTIDFVKDKGNHFATAANFTLIQPGAADLLDQIQAAKVHLGIEAGMYANVPIFLEINFKGYEASLEEEDQKGKEAQEEGYQDSLDEFIRGDSEVLVASIKCAGTGVDGLQSVCNRAIFFQLPWTSTEFEQTVGRLDRDGTDFDSVEVFLPMTDVSLPDGERWSWCRSKLDRIESKRDIAKAAVDGEIPDAASLISPSEASKYWLNWLQKLEQGGKTSQAAE